MAHAANTPHVTLYQFYINLLANDNNNLETENDAGDTGDNENIVNDRLQIINIADRITNYFSVLRVCYKWVSKIYSFYKKVLNFKNLALFSLNLKLWLDLSSSGNSILPVAITGLCFIKDTSKFETMAINTALWLTGYRKQKTIRKIIKAILLVSGVKTIINSAICWGLVYNFSPLTYILKVPMAIVNVVYHSSSVIGLSYLLSNRFLQDANSFLANNRERLPNYIFDNQKTVENYESMINLIKDRDPQYCSICMQDDRWIIAQINKCQHKFCDNCLYEWYLLPGNNIFSCPLCRLPSENLYQKLVFLETVEKFILANLD